MNAEVFSEWLQRQGHRVYHTQSSYWYNAGPRVLQAFPYHWLINPGKEELRSLLTGRNIAALRYSSPADSECGKLSYHIVLGRNYDLNTLSNKARNGVKKGLDCFQIENISFERLAIEGWHLEQDTLIRQHRVGSIERRQWYNLCIAAKNLPGFEAWAAISGDELAAAVIICRIDDVYYVPFAMSHCRFLRNHVNNALFYSVSCRLLKREGVKSIFFTVQSLDAPSNVDEFKLRMGFEPRIVRQNVVVHPYLRPVISKPVHNLTRRLLKHYPSNNMLAKTEGMMRFYIEGRNPVREQSVPECLIHSRQHNLEIATQ